MSRASLCWSLAFFLGIFSGNASASGPLDRPNIVFILADDLGYGDLGCFGAPDVRTPHLDRLAREGARLTDCYANESVCSPTRLAFMTGRYQQRLGLEWAISYGVRGEGLPPEEVSLAKMLKAAGYTTAMSGKWHLGYDVDRAPNHHGFDHFFGLLGGNHHYFEHYDRKGEHDLWLDTRPLKLKGYSTDLITDYALEFVRQMKAGPFFLYLPYNAPHFPYQAPDEADREVTPKKGWQTGTRASYVKMVESIDANVGRLLDELQRLQLTRKTLIVFTSDNGGMEYSRNAPLAKNKGTLWEGGIRVSTVACWPGKIPAGAVCAQAAVTMDWTATFARLAGAKPPVNRPFDGLDLLPILTGKQAAVERTLFWRRVLDPYRKNVQPHRAVRQGDWKYIDEPGGTQYLYDLSQDIGERQNLAAENPTRATAMKKLLDSWEREMGPPRGKAAAR